MSDANNRPETEAERGARLRAQAARAGFIIPEDEPSEAVENQSMEAQA